MRQKYTWFFRGAICVSLLLLISQGALGSISGSGHDFSGFSWSDGEICKPCHTPHNATSLQGAPLWNHELSTATYTLYSSPTMDVTVNQPGPVSKACLSCHDGTIALDSFGGNTTGSTIIAASALIGTDLSVHHPIGIDWDHQTTGGGPCNTCHTGHAGGGPSDMLLKPDSIQVYDGNIECASCHDAHNGANLPNLLRITMATSTLCLTCHTDK